MPSLTEFLYYIGLDKADSLFGISFADAVLVVSHFSEGILDMLLCTYRLPHPVILVREVKLELQVEKQLVGRGHPGDDFTDLPDIGNLYLMAFLLFLA